MDTDIVRIIGFNHWVDLGFVPKLLEYNGWKYAIHNRTSNCIEAIEEPVTRFHSGECSDLDYIDPQLQVWAENFDRKILSAAKSVATIHKDDDDSYIYCYGTNITIQEQRYACPPEPFKLPNSMNFSTNGIRHISRSLTEA